MILTWYKEGEQMSSKTLKINYLGITYDLFMKYAHGGIVLK